MNMNFYFVPARDPTSASCGIERNSCIVPLQACHPKPLCTNQLLPFTLYGWFLGDWIEPHFSPQRKNLQNPGSAWDSVICDISLSSWGLFFLLQEGKHMQLFWEQVIISSIQVISIWNDTLKKPSLALFLPSLLPHLHEDEELDTKTTPLSS